MFQDSLFSQFIFTSRYARYLDKENRRENWPETVKRYMDFLIDYIKDNNEYIISDELRINLENAILEHKIMPSMRLLMTAGIAAKRNSIAAYNCSFISIDDLKTLDEMMAILMSGTGVGFSVELINVKNLPELPDNFYQSESIIVFDDSRIGWAKGYREFISILLTGQIPKYDVSKLRPAGARLKTMGGRSSGSEPLVDLLEFTKQIFQKAKGRKLTTLEVHDLACKIGDIVVQGGVRRSALISLSDLHDNAMRSAKSGQWWITNPYRRLSNNSAVYNEKPDIGTFMKEWISLYESKSGERGIFSRAAIKKIIDNSNEFRQHLVAAYISGHTGKSNPFFGVRSRKYQDDMGTNPCAEIILRPYEFCNLTEVVIYPDDTEETLKEKVQLATILGTFQSCLTNFKYINKKWQRNCEDERLLGVSLTGIFDNELTNGRNYMYNGLGRDNLINLLQELKKITIKTNIEYAELIGINSSVAITCVKPSGTSSAFNGTSSGIHPAHAPYYIRYVRNDRKDPLTDFMIENGFPFEKDVYDSNNVVCFKFPMQAVNSICKNDISAIDHLKLWLIYQKYFCEHKPSITVSVKENEWLKVGAWCYENFDWLSGISFLPAEESDTIYKQSPFTTCTKEEYEELVKQMPENVNWSNLTEFEKEDMTTNAKELACSAGGCEII